MFNIKIILCLYPYGVVCKFQRAFFFLAEMTGANISVFWCSSKEISIGTEKKVKLNIEFLPFTTGHFQCSVLLINEEIGDIVYSIEAESTLPLPSLLPNQTSIHSVNFSNQDERERGDSSSEFDTRTVYWRCNINDEISEDIIVPLINEAREKALGNIFNSNIFEDYLVRIKTHHYLNISRPSTVSSRINAYNIHKGNVIN